MQYNAKQFNLPTLAGISAKQIEVHLGLYEGYVKHVNLLREQIANLETLDKEKYAYAVMEVRRRLAFEFNGMRMHEYYFEQFEGEKSSDSKSAFAVAIAEKYVSWNGFIAHIKEVAGTRGIGWVVVYSDPIVRTIHTVFVADHEVGQLSGLPILLALDLWEHAYMVDYLPSEKKNYVDAFLENLNWSVVEKRFDISATVSDL